MKVNILYFLAFSLIASSSLFSQNEEEEFPYKYNFQILFWVKSDFYNPYVAKPAPLNLTFLTKDGPEDFTAYQGAISPVYAYQAAKPLVFYSKKTTNEETTYDPLISPNIKSKKGYYLIMLTDEGNNNFSTKILDVSEKIIPKGSIKFYNYSTEPLRARFGQKKFAIKPGSVVSANMSELSDTYYCPYKIARNQQGKWKPVLSNDFPIDKSNRLLNIFYHHDLTEGPILMRTVNLSRPPTEASEQEAPNEIMPLPGAPGS